MRFLSTERHPDPEAVRAAWHRFVSTPDCAPQSVRPYVWRAWQRSRAAGCDAWLPRAQVLGACETEALLRRREPLLAVGAPFLEALSRAAGADRHAAMLADQDGRLLRLAADAQTLADPNFPRPGSLLSEALAGANGVGTALAEDGYVELVGAEHYIEGFHAFTCQGVPLRGPRGVVGVLSMSVRRLETADRVRDILFCASQAAECELLARWLSDAVRDLDDPALEQLRQDIVQGITLARLRLELAARQLATGAGAGDTLEAALRLTGRFTRQAALWRDLALDGDDEDAAGPQALELAELVEDFLALMQTQARVSAVELAWGAADRVRTLARRRALWRQLLGIFLSALQTAAAGPRLQVSVRRRGAAAVIELQALPAGTPGGGRHSLECAALG
jgi:transcriptional regulator of acetoin/glycerol metabolism